MRNEVSQPVTKSSKKLCCLLATRKVYDWFTSDLIQRELYDFRIRTEHKEVRA